MSLRVPAVLWTRRLPVSSQWVYTKFIHHLNTPLLPWIRLWGIFVWEIVVGQKFIMTVDALLDKTAKDCWLKLQIFLSDYNHQFLSRLMRSNC